jgi:hypothetical protein
MAPQVRILARRWALQLYAARVVGNCRWDAAKCRPGLHCVAIASHNVSHQIDASQILFVPAGPGLAPAMSASLCEQRKLVATDQELRLLTEQLKQVQLHKLQKRRLYHRACVLAAFVAAVTAVLLVWPVATPLQMSSQLVPFIKVSSKAPLDQA